MSLVRKTATSLILSSILLFITPIKTFAFEPLSSWSQQQSLPYSIASHVSTINNNKLSIIGGATNFSTSEISQTEINNVGNLTTWQTFQNLTSPLFWNSIAKNENFVYLLGGSINTSTYPTNTVYVGTNNLQNWSTTTPLSSPLALGNSIIVNNKIYYSGGGLDSNFTSISSKVYVADINPDGTLGSWAETTPLPEPLFGHGMIETGSKIIIIGGRTSMWYSNPRVYEATINPNGTLGTWTQTNSLPTPISRAGVIKKGNIIYVVGGESLQGPGSITFLKKVYYTTVDQNASIGPWLESQYELPQPLCCGSLATTDTNMYYTGGHNSTGYLNTVYMSSIGNSLPSLIVPDIKQYSSPWNSQIYDSANNWYPSNPTIERWGCALTSAAMVLNYFNHQIDPGVLNTWLKAQPDGYIRNGLLNWLSVSRYTLQHNSSSSPTLEYKRQDTSYLVPELTESRPAILEEPGHFVVAKSQLPTTFGINDPAYSNRPTLESYNNSFLSLGSYIPSHTDLSYIYLLIDPAFKIEVFDPAGNKIEGFSFTSQPITDNFSLQTSGTPLNTFMYPKPAYGEYRVEISGPTGQYQLDSYLYNQNGEVQLSSFNRSISNNEVDTYEITIGETPQISQQSTFESLLEDLANAWNQKKITKLQTYNLLRLEIELAQKLNFKENLQAARSLLTVTKLHLKLFSPSFIDKEFSIVIQNEIQSLLDTLIQTS